MVRSNGKVAAISGEQGRCRPLSQNRLASLNSEGVGWCLHHGAVAKRHCKNLSAVVIDHVHVIFSFVRNTVRTVFGLSFAVEPMAAFSDGNCAVALKPADDGRLATAETRPGSPQ